MFENLNWKYKNPFIEEFTVTKEDIDILGHVNNKVYLNWCEIVSWKHSARSVSYTHLTLPTKA